MQAGQASLSKQAVYYVTCINCLASSLEQQQLIKGFKYVDGGLMNGAHNCAACIDNVAHCAHHNSCCSCVQSCTTTKWVWDAASTVWVVRLRTAAWSKGDALRSTQSPAVMHETYCWLLVILMHVGEKLGTIQAACRYCTKAVRNQYSKWP